MTVEAALRLRLIQCARNRTILLSNGRDRCDFELALVDATSSDWLATFVSPLDLTNAQNPNGLPPPLWCSDYSGDDVLRMIPKHQKYRSSFSCSIGTSEIKNCLLTGDSCQDCYDYTNESRL